MKQISSGVVENEFSANGRALQWLDCMTPSDGVIPKGHNTGKWRLIMDLSYPPEQSVNDSIDCQLYAPWSTRQWTQWTR